MTYPADAVVHLNWRTREGWVAADIDGSLIPVAVRPGAHVRICVREAVVVLETESEGAEFRGQRRFYVFERHLGDEFSLGQCLFTFLCSVPVDWDVSEDEGVLCLVSGYYDGERDWEPYYVDCALEVRALLSGCVVDRVEVAALPVAVSCESGRSTSIMAVIMDRQDPCHGERLLFGWNALSGLYKIECSRLGDVPRSRVDLRASLSSDSRWVAIDADGCTVRVPSECADDAQAAPGEGSRLKQGVLAEIRQGAVYCTVGGRSRLIDGDSSCVVHQFDSRAVVVTLDGSVVYLTDTATSVVRWRIDTEKMLRCPGRVRNLVVWKDRWVAAVFDRCMAVFDIEQWSWNAWAGEFRWVCTVSLNHDDQALVLSNARTSLELPLCEIEQVERAIPVAELLRSEIRLLEDLTKVNVAVLGPELIDLHERRLARLGRCHDLLASMMQSTSSGEDVNVPVSGE